MSSVEPSEVSTLPSASATLNMSWMFHSSAITQASSARRMRSPHMFTGPDQPPQKALTKTSAPFSSMPGASEIIWPLGRVWLPRTPPSAFGFTSVLKTSKMRFQRWPEPLTTVEAASALPKEVSGFIAERNGTVAVPRSSALRVGVFRAEDFVRGPFNAGARGRPRRRIRAQGAGLACVSDVSVSKRSDVGDRGAGRPAAARGAAPTRVLRSAPLPRSARLRAPAAGLSGRLGGLTTAV